MTEELTTTEVKLACLDTALTLCQGATAEELLEEAKKLYEWVCTVELSND